MKAEEIEILKEKYKTLVSSKSVVIEKQKELDELAKDEKVKRYIELSREISMLSKPDAVIEVDEDKILEETIREVKTSNTNNYYLYMGTFAVEGNRDRKVDVNDPEATYSLYRCLELSYGDVGYEVKVPISRRTKFESENKVINQFGVTLNEYYFELKKKYFKAVIEHDEQYAYESVLRRKF